MAGEYAIHILCDNEDINCSPFITQIQPKSNLRPDLVKCYGPGIQPNGVIINCATDFKVDLSKARKTCNAPLEINVRITKIHCLTIHFQIIFFLILNIC